MGSEQHRDRVDAVKHRILPMPPTCGSLVPFHHLRTQLAGQHQSSHPDRQRQELHLE
jgi:hypothetical protein